MRQKNGRFFRTQDDNLVDENFPFSVRSHDGDKLSAPALGKLRKDAFLGKKVRLLHPYPFGDEEWSLRHCPPCYGSPIAHATR
ncbi:MAG: hypothetical protein J5855_02410 [Mailhella sp.]|nr:hypothetical protein [Mailhella sp.]